MKLGIVGLPNVGKSTLFNSLTKAGAESANYPFCTIDPNVGVVTVPDDRLKALGEMYHSKKVTPAVIEFVDIAGLVKGASKGEGLGNQFLSNIREVDAIVHVVRCFEDPNVIHVDGSVNPLRDIETINLELIFADLEVLERRLSKVVKAARMDKTYAKELALLERIKEHLESGKMAKSLDVTDEDELALLKEYNLLTYKPVIYAANVAEDDLADDGASNEMVAKVREFAAGEHSEVFVICAQIEEEISELDDDEKAMFLDDLGLKESGLEKLIKASYHILGLMSFLTAGEDETRAWTIKIGTKAPKAILLTAQELNSPVILGVSEGAGKYMTGYKTVVGMVNGMMEELNITVPVALHLDHGSYEGCLKCVEAGFSSIMFDGSHYPIEENVAKTKELVKIVAEHGMSLEAEVGSIGGEEDGVVGMGECADPQECKMIADLGIDFLAAGIGNIHGKYPANWKGLSFETLDAIEKLS